MDKIKSITIKVGMYYDRTVGGGVIWTLKCPLIPRAKCPISADDIQTNGHVSYSKMGLEGK